MPKKSKMELPIPNPRTIEFGKTLRALRLEHKITLQELSDKLEIEYSFLSKMETGMKSVPDIELFDALDDALHLSEPETELLRFAAQYIPKNIDMGYQYAHVFKALRDFGLQVSDIPVLVRYENLLKGNVADEIRETVSKARELLPNLFSENSSFMRGSREQE